MSQHAQSSQFSTTIHTQWGYLLSYGSFFRLLTFLILFLVPNTNSAASKPFTELITSFCLLCGGLVFMESTDQSIEAMEYRGFTPMFTFNLSVGFVSLLMAWEMILFIWKDWLIKTRKTSL
nr:YCR062W [Saccharomyces cerevisiae]